MRISGIQKECMTSCEAMLKTTVRSTGSTRRSELNFCGTPSCLGYSKDQAHCWPVTLICSACASLGSSRSSPMLSATCTPCHHMPITMMSGTMVQAISKPLWLWKWGPSAVSPGRRRKATRA